MTEAQYNSAIAIYNPNGGHRVGKIYDVRDIGTVKSFVKTRATKWAEVFGTVTSGELDYQGRPTADRITRTDTSDIILRTGINEKSGNTFTSYTIEAKRGSLRYLNFSMNYFYGGADGSYYFDLETGTFVDGDTTTTSEDLGDGWYRVTKTVDATNSNDSGQYNIRFTSSPNSIVSTVGDYGILGRVQAIEGSNYQLAESNPTTDLAVSGGGGTRINKVGNVEDIIYNKFTTATNFDANLGGHIKTTGHLAPDGSNTAQRTLVSGNSYFTFRYLAYATGAGANLSIYAKHYQGSGLLQLQLTNDYVEFDLINGVIASQTLNPTYISNPKITSVGDGWYRCSVEKDSSDIADVRIRHSGADGDGLYLWGRQYVENEKELKPLQLTGLGGFPKIDYSTGRPAFLLEPTSTNYIPYSNDFSQWTIRNNAVLTPYSEIAPDGTQTASKVVGTGSINDDIFRGSSLSTGGTLSIWMKSLSGQTVSIRMQTVNSGSNGDSYDVTGEWKRYTYQVPEGGTSGGLHLRYMPVGGIAIWGAQHENGGLTSLIPTNGAAVTRTSSSLKYDVNSNTPFFIGKWVYGEAKLLSTEPDKPLMGISNTRDSTPRAGLDLMWNGSSWNFDVRPSNTAIETVSTGITSTDIKFAMKATSGRIHTLILNGQVFTNTTTTTHFSFSQVMHVLDIGTTQSHLNGGKGTIHAAFYDLRILPDTFTNQEMIELTTL